MARPQPRKPAKQTAILRFPKSGRVSRDVLDWPRTKEEQEATAVEVFVALLARHTGRQLADLRSLAERDHDVEARESDTRVLIQVTELVTRDLVEELCPGVFRLDTERLKDALADRIQSKVEHYPKETGARLILLVYSLDAGAHEFLVKNVTRSAGPGELVIPEGLRRAQRVARDNPGPFDEIWYVMLTAGSDPTGLLAGVLPAEGKSGLSPAQV
jgi:hypothetical protein